MTDLSTTDELLARWRSEQWWMFHLPPAVGLVGLSQLLRVMRPYYGQTTYDEFTVFMNRSRDDIWVTAHKRRMTPAQLDIVLAQLGPVDTEERIMTLGALSQDAKVSTIEAAGALLAGAPPGAVEAALARLNDALPSQAGEVTPPHPQDVATQARLEEHPADVSTWVRVAERARSGNWWIFQLPRGAMDDPLHRLWPATIADLYYPDRPDGLDVVEHPDGRIWMLAHKDGMTREDVAYTLDIPVRDVPKTGVMLLRAFGPRPPRTP
jgi:hypothetical protein